MKTGGNARYFFIVKSVKTLKKAITFAKEKNTQIFILGGGSKGILIDSAGSSAVTLQKIVFFVYNNGN